MKMNLKFNKLKPDDPRGRNAVMDNFRDEKLHDTEIFIREFLQNVLDNRINGDSHARVKINFHKIDNDNNKKFIDDIFNPAIPYICASEGTNNIADDLSSEALVLEEYGTEGITGVTDNSDDDKKWATFWHFQAQSNKSGNLNGRAGQGKISYHMMSKFWTVFGLTNTIDEPEKLYLMGKCILPKTFMLEGDTYKSQAFISDSKEVKNGNQPIPFENSEIDDFCSAFSISRELGHSGTTWVIPYPKQKLDEERLITAVIKGYYYSILKKKLSVEIGQEIIDNESILALSKKYLTETETQFYAFIKQIADESAYLEKTRVRLVSKWFKSITTSLTEESFPDKDQAKQLKDNFNAGEIVAVKLPVTLYRNNSYKVDTFYTVYLKSDDSIEKTNEAFIRTDLVISGEEKLSGKPGNVLGLIVADDPEIASFLADSEIANHTKFSAKMEDVNNNYVRVEPTLKKIRYGEALIYEYLSQVKAEKSKDLLKKIFSIASEAKGKNKERNIEEKKKEEEEEKIIEEPEIDEDIPTNSKFFKIIDTTDGFEINPGSLQFPKEELPARLKIETGYESIELGSPFSNHHPFDYNFLDPDSSISKELDNMSIVKNTMTSNELQLDVEDVSFSAIFSGFNPDSRLRVRITSYQG